MKTTDLHDTMDAKVWADEFCRLNNAADHGMMLAWFANAIMVGWDFAKRSEASAQAATDDVRDAALEEAAKLCETAEILFDTSVWQRTSKQGMSGKTALALAACIRALKRTTPAQAVTEDKP